MIYGYARVSTTDQNLDRQLDQLRNYGCNKIFQEKITGTKKNRPELNKLLDIIQKGDTIIVADLTRLSRSTLDLLDIVGITKTKGAYIKSIKDTWLDTTSNNPYNDFLLTVMSGLAQLERDLISQRTKEGLEAARKKGHYGGRPKKSEIKVNAALEMYNEGKTVREIEEITGVSRATLYRRLKETK